MSETTRPKRVIIVDADNPLQEIHGEFFWREDHDQIVAAEQDKEFKRGYAQGYLAALQTKPQVVVRPRRRSLGRLLGRLLVWPLAWLLRWTLIMLVTVGFAVALVESFIHR